MFAKLADTVLKRSKIIIVIWIVILACSLPFALKSSDVLEYDMTKMSGSNSEATEGQKIIDEYFDNALDLSEVLVIGYKSADELKLANTLTEKFKSLMGKKYGDKITITNGGSYSKDPASGVGVLLIAIQNNDSEHFDLTHETGNIRGIVSQAKSDAGATGLTALVTGNDAISYDTENSSMEDVKKVDPISILLIFILLALFFYAVVTAFVPPAVVGMAYGITLTLIWALGQFLGIYYITSTLLLVVMLGAGCDYSIFIITRYRNERKSGVSHEVALKEAIMWGGESVATSGISVMIGFAALALCSFAMVQTMGIALALGIFVALIAALTFIPSLINLFGDKIFWPSNIDKYIAVDESFETPGKGKGFHHALASIGRKYFSWLARFTGKYAMPIVAVFVIISIPATYYYTTANDSYDMISVMPDSESVDGLNLIMEQTSGGTIMPTYVVLQLKEDVATKVGTLPLLGSNILYMVWSDSGKTVAAQMMALSAQIEKQYGENGEKIVDSVSGLNMYSVIFTQTKAAMPDATTEQINKYIVENLLPSAVKSYVEEIFTKAAGIAGIPEENKYMIDTSAEILPSVAGYTLSQTIDYILNVGTGILSSTHYNYVNMMIVTSEKPMSDNTMKFVVNIGNDFHKSGGYDEKYDFIEKSYVTGTSANIYNIGEIVEDQFSMIKIVVIVLLILLLFFILGCYVTPIRALITIVLSVIWTVGLTHLLFEDMLNTPVLFLIPIVLFVVLLGLGMDYEIFLTTKIRENKIKGMDNHTAIEEAVKSSGGVISLCALLMGGTFLTLLLAGSSMLQELGFALGVGILIDGLFMVGFVSPALMHLLGDWSWIGPKFLQKKMNAQKEPSDSNTLCTDQDN